MSKKSKKILAYLMFFAALCGTPAVSEARGGSGGQVATEKVSVAQRGNSSSSLISGLLSNYGFEAVKWMLLGGGSFGFAKMSKVGDLNALARYLLNLKDAKSKDAEKLMKQLDDQRKALDKDKKDFDVQRAKALNDHTNLNNEKVALELSNKSLNAKVKESEKKIEELEKSKAKLKDEVSNLKGYNNQLLNINNGDNQKIDALLWSYLPVKMVGELAMFTDESWKQNSYNKGGNRKVDVTPYSSNQGDVIVASAKYNTEGEMLGDPEWLTLKADELFGALAEKAGDGELLVNVSLKNIGLEYCGVPYLARYSYSVGNDILAFYFPVKNALEINVGNNVDGENIGENNGVNHEEDNENLKENKQDVNNNVVNEEKNEKNENNVNNENNENNENVNNEVNNQ